MGGKCFIAGHSLGAADAALYAYSRVKRGLRVDGVFLFACPRPGNAVIGANLKNAAIPLRSIRNLGDGVPDVPLDVHAAQFGWAYANVAPFEMIDEPPSFAAFMADPFFAHHNISLYQMGAHELPQGSLDITLGQAVDEVARLYTDTTDWNWISTANGLYWSMVRFPNGASLIIRRGSVTGRDWLGEDFDFNEIGLFDARVSNGFWLGVGPIENELDATVAA